MKLPIFQVDAFSARTFGGNPAAVCPLPEFLEDAAMQAVAAENNLAETAFIVPRGEAAYDIRWFTPLAEVDLCGHATVASAYVLFNHLRPDLKRVTFGSKSGPLPVSAENGRIVLDFPALPAKPVLEPAGLAAALGAAPIATLEASALLAIFGSEADVRALKPDPRAVAAVHWHGVIVTAPGDEVDFVSRFFAPNYGLDEDPVTGSAHCTLAPYWAERLRKTRLHALQVSKRGGELWCEVAGDRVRIGGKAAPYLEGTIEI